MLKGLHSQFLLLASEKYLDPQNQTLAWIIWPVGLQSFYGKWPHHYCGMVCGTGMGK